MGRLNGRQLEFIRTLLAAGAVSPESAVTTDKNTPVTQDELEAMVQAGAITRVAPYRYHLRPESRHAKLIAALDSRMGDPDPALPSLPWTRARIIKALTFWILVILIPLLLMQLFGSR